MKTTEITEFSFDGQRTLVLRLENDFLGISADPEIVLDKYELEEVIDRLMSICSYMALPNEDGHE